jgi:hypothetical protein
VNTAVDGTKIWVDAGTFQEQVFVGKTVDIAGVDRTKTIVKAPVTLTGFTNANGTSYAIIYADGNANTINIDGILVDGDNGRPNSTFVGVHYFAASGSFKNSRITGIRNNPYSGTQGGTALTVNHQWDVSVNHTVYVTDNIIDDYQKGGIVINELNTHGIVTGNVVTGQNIPNVNGQNGIQLGFGAYGTITGNTVTNNIWNKVEHPHEWTASGILLVGVGVNYTNTPTGNLTVVGPNILNGNEVGLFTGGDNTYGYLSNSGLTVNASTFANNKIHTMLADPATVPPVGDSYDKRVDNLTQTNIVYGCIQYAVDEATPAGGDILTASAGTFAENVVVHTPVTILGPKATVSGCDAGRGTGEAIVVPFTDDVYGEIFHVAASNVTIKGFTIDGDNPALPANGYGFGGADMHAAEGVTVYETGINNLNVTNNIFKNLLYFGVTLYDYPSGVPSSGHIISYNKFQDLGTYDPASTMEYWGGGVLLYNNQYTSVTNNCMSNVRLGIQTGNFWQANPGLAISQLITDNTIEARRTGIFHNLHYSAASPITLSNNIINALANTNETRWDGIALSSLSVASYSLNNTINGNGITLANLSKGYGVWNVKNTYPALIDGGSVSGVDYGVFANNFEGYSSNGTDGAHAVINNMIITPKTSGTGIYALYSPSYTGTATTINVQAFNNFITGGVDGVKLTENVAGTVSAIVNNNHITGNSGFGLNSTILNVVDATCNWWGTANGNLIAPMISGAVNYIYWLENGTDNEPGTPGFQPVPNSCTGAPDFSGNYKYFNNGFTPLSNITVELWKDDAKVYPVSGNVTTDASGNFTFVNVDPDTYEVRSSTSKSVGGINSTDAAQVNFWSVNPSSIEKVRFYAGDVTNDNSILSGDASNIQGYFLTSGGSGFARAPWSFWTAGETISGNPDPGGYPTLVVPGSGPTVTKNFYGLVTGDFNRSFTPSAKDSGSGSITLQYGQEVSVAYNETVELPIVSEQDIKMGAISLILGFPSQLMEIENVFLGADLSNPVPFNVTGDELRVSWHSLTPVSVQAGDPLLTLMVSVTGDAGADGILFTLAADPLNELADGFYDVIPAAVLTIDILKTSAMGVAPNNHADMLELSNYPNPFKGTTTFVYSLPVEGRVTLEIFDIVGNKVHVLMDEVQTAGNYRLNMNDNSLLPGVYTAMIRLQDSESVSSRVIKIISR